MTLQSYRTAVSPRSAEASFGTGAYMFGVPVLNHLRHGIALIDEVGTVIFHNRALDELMHRDTGIAICGCRLCAAHSVENIKLQAMIGSCIRGARHLHRPADMTIWGQRGEHSLLVSVLPVLRDPMSPGLSEQIAVMVLVVDTEPTVQLDDDFLTATLRFSRAEAFVARRLLEGVTLSEIAEEKGITIHTARSQLKSIMQKAGVSRQSDLVSLLSRCDAIRRSPH